MTGFFIMSYSVIDGYGARASFSPLSYIGWSFILNAAIFPILLIYKNKARTILKIAKEGKKILQRCRTKRTWRDPTYLTARKVVSLTAKKT